MAHNQDTMGDIELGSIVDSMISDSVSHSSEFMKKNEEYLRRYYQEPYGDEDPDFSQVIASDVSDTVEADMTSMVRVFLGSGSIITFDPVTDDEAEVLEAQEKTELINYLVQDRPGAYKVIHDFLKDAEIQKMGVLSYFMDTVRETKEVAKDGVSAETLTIIIDQIAKPDDKTKKAEIVAQDQNDDGLFNVRIRITTEVKQLVIDNIATEDFLLSKNSKSLDDAQAVGHISYPTRSELVASGMPEDEVSDFPTSSPSSSSSQVKTNDSNSQNMKAIRFRDEGGEITDTQAFSEWSAQTVKRVTLYALIDFDNDGVQERRRVIKIGNTITENEPYDHVPYAITSAIIEPHKAIGEGRASLVIQDQSVNTELQRAVLDNVYDAANPRTLLGDSVNQDDFLDERRSGVVRMTPGAKLTPKDSVTQLVTPYVGDVVLQVMQSRDQEQAQRTGGLLSSQGLEADQLHRETATRFAGIEKASEAKIELVARNHAETGFRKLYEGIAWTLQRFQDEEMKVRVAGKPIAVTPSTWQFPTVAVSQVGLGAGAGEQTVQQLSGILAIQEQLKSSNSLLVDEQKTYNTLDKMVKGLGFAQTGEFFNNPDVPVSQLMAMYQQLVVAMQQAQAQIEQLSQGNPLAEAEMVKQQGTMAIKREQNQTDLLKTTEQSRLKELEMIRDGAQFQAEQTFKYTELEVENNVDVPGQGQ